MAFPLKPPRDWFQMPEAETPTPLTFEKSGKVYGHLAIWGSCHRGFLNGALSECVQAPRSGTNYSQFHLAPVETQEGEDVKVGKITYATGHAPLAAGLPAATEHYDHTGSVGAFVRARDGALGIWASGAVRSGISEEGFRDLRANPPSGDWRSLARRGLEMIAALAVPVPGLPVIPQIALRASASGEPEVVSLILPPWTLDEEEPALVASAEYRARKKELSLLAGVRVPRDRSYIRKVRALSASVERKESDKLWHYVGPSA